MITFIGLSVAIEITVGPKDSDFSSIQAAVNAAKAGDLIEVRGGIYRENVVVDKKLDLEGLGEPVVDAGDKGSTFTLLAGGRGAEWLHHYRLPQPAWTDGGGN